MPEHSRRSIRLQDYDYTQNGAYFVTICTHEREHLLGEVVGDVVRLNEYGEIVREEWLRTAEIRREMELDAFVIMPNHMHMIILIVGNHAVPITGAHSRAPLQRQPRSLGAFVAGFKSAVTKRINSLRETPNAPVWQRNYYDAIIRSDITLNALRQYIEANPARWATDKENRQP